jgi:hypothetical protein
MADFWRGSGFRLLDRDDTGRLQPTDDFLRMYLQRPELAPPEDACAAERRLHTALTEDPRREVSPAQIGAIADEDARENYGVMLEFRDRLLASSSLEGCYLSMFHDRLPRMAPVFVDQLAQLIVRNILDGTDDALEARASELLFREQRVSVQDGAVLLADAGTADMHESTGGLGNIGRLMQERRTPLRRVELKVLDPESSALYWMRDERFDTVLQINASHSREALGRVVGRWIEHFFGTPVTVNAVRTIDSARWVWHVGLDAESTRILNGIYNGEEPDEPSLQRILCLFELSFRNASDLRPEMEGRPVSLGLAMTPESGLRMKPQNLLTNLPLARRL